MATRIQFRTTEQEFLIISQNAAKAGYPSISQFVKELALADPSSLKNSNALQLSFREIYDDVKKAVNDFVFNNPNGSTFVLRDIVPSWKTIPQHENVPTGTIPKPLRASVGKHFFSEVKAGVEYPNVRFADKVDKYGTAIYEVCRKVESLKQS